MSLEKSSALMSWVDDGANEVCDSHVNGSAVHVQGIAAAGSPPPNPGKLKKFVRRGLWPVNHDIRRDLWYHSCMRNVVAKGSVYKETAKALFGEDQDANLEAQLFGNENHLKTYHLTRAGRHELTRLLCVLAHTRPDINYCPLLHPIASLLLHYMEADRAYDCLSALLGSSGYRYLDQSWVEVEAYRRSFVKLAKKFASHAHALIGKQSDYVDVVYRDWIWWILEDLPFAHLVCVMDCYFVEGLKIFYRVGLAILQLFKKEQKGRKVDISDYASAIRLFTKSLPVTPQVLLEIGFQFRGLSRTIIDTYATKFRQNIREEGSCPPAVTATRSVPFALREIKSTIVNPKQLQTLWRWLPERIALKQPRVIFTTTEHGVSLTTFFNMCEEEEQTLLLIKTFDKEVFGAYLSCPWYSRHETKASYFGNGECFLYTLTPTEQQHPWVGMDDREASDPVATVARQMFMRATNNLLSIGGGDGEGLHFENDMTQGTSEACLTFNNQPLARSSPFQCETVEVIAFEEGSSQGKTEELGALDSERLGSDQNVDSTADGGAGMGAIGGGMRDGQMRRIPVVIVDVGTPPNEMDEED